MISYATLVHNERDEIECLLTYLIKHKSVEDEIVIMSSTCPDLDLIKHDSALQDTPKINLMGNTYLKKALSKDVNKKVSTWMFGTYPHAINEIRDGIRWISNPKADNFVYNPKPIQVRF